jgi:hypothetical protein
MFLDYLNVRFVLYIVSQKTASPRRSLSRLSTRSSRDDLVNFSAVIEREPNSGPIRQRVGFVVIYMIGYGISSLPLAGESARKMNGPPSISGIPR